jgi:hypothetical protein
VFGNGLSCSTRGEADLSLSVLLTQPRRAPTEYFDSCCYEQLPSDGLFTGLSRGDGSFTGHYQATHVSSGSALLLSSLYVTMLWYVDPLLGRGP